MTVQKKSLSSARTVVRKKYPVKNVLLLSVI